MENTKMNSKRQVHPDRITLNPEALNRVNEWLKSINTSTPGVSLGRADLVNFVISSHAPQLSKQELKELESLHRDDVKLMAWALRTLKEARANGKSLSIEEILQSALSKKE